MAEPPLGFLDIRWQPNILSCGWTHPHSAYTAHCEQAHGGPGSRFHSGQPTLPHQDDCRCCGTDAPGRCPVTRTDPAKEGPTMTLQEAAEHVGDKVIYRTRGLVEEGVITSVNDLYVFVRYGSQTTSAATFPGMLRLLAAVPAAVPGRATTAEGNE